MLLVKNTTGGQTYSQGEQFEIFREERFVSTKTPARSGRWYFEATLHHGSGGFLVGFNTNIGYLDFYPYFNNSSPTLYFENFFSTTSSSIQRIRLPFSVVEPYTIGVGIDLDNNIFSIYYQHYTYSYHINSSHQIRTLNAEVWGAHDDRTHEYVSVNYGENKFEYLVPGILAWKLNFRPITCKQSLSLIISYSLLSINLLESI